MRSPPLIGVFVGGQGRRMGGVAKGLLPAPDGGTLIERLLRIIESSARESGVAAPVVLVGSSEPYAELKLPTIADEPGGIGPLGGLSALLARARDEARGAALALSCDLPFVTPRLVSRLMTEAPDAPALAPRVQTMWSPLTARYSVAALPVILEAISEGQHSLQGVFARLGTACRELLLNETERSALLDWDSPEDMRR